MAGTSDHIEGLIDRYLNHRLDAADRAAFERLLLEDEQLFERVQLLDAFKRSLHAEGARLAAVRKQPALPLRAWLRQPLSIAASVLVLGLGALQLLDRNDAAPVAQPIDSVFMLDATRDRPLPVLSGAPPYLLQLHLGPLLANMPVAVTLRSAAGEELLRVDTLAVDRHGWARLLFAQVLSGDYILEFAPVAHPEAIRSFPLTVSY